MHVEKLDRVKRYTKNKNQYSRREVLQMPKVLSVSPKSKEATTISKYITYV